ncbi:MAG TPA: Mu-like prophage major head subunit gpT family protein [Thermoanaerobaculia bacterium]|jgi:phage major head subunit gpT-like protein|nr:Mu-like prophage major head subunit gpT family protein [Thermoanaerobaculia bacterium]
MLSDLKSIAVKATPIALDVYDKTDPTTLLPLVAVVVSDPSLAEEVNLEWAAVFPELRKWIGDRVAQQGFAGRLRIRPELYEVTLDFDSIDIERGTALLQATEKATRIGRAFAVGKVLLAYRVLRENLLTYDGQDFFSNAHQHPDGTYASNVLPVTRANFIAPTVDEARFELTAAVDRLMYNSILRDELVRSEEVRKGLVVFVRSQRVWSAYEKLRTEKSFGADPNLWQGAFELVRDFKPKLYTEDTVDVVLATPNGPRPAIFVVSREPQGLKFDQSKEFASRYIPFGMDAMYGVTPAFWQTAVRVLQQPE